MTVDIPREIALKIIYDITEKGAYSNISINKYIEAADLKDVDRAFITDLTYGTIKWKQSIDWIIEQFSSIKIKKLSPWIFGIMRLGVYQLMYTDKIPESAACNECVKLAKKYGHSASSGYVNAVLRNIARNKADIKYPDKQKEYLKYLTVRYSHPEWLVKEWLERFGGEFTESLLDINNTVPDFTVRVNALKVSKEKLIEIFKEAGLEAEGGRYLENAIVVKNPSSIAKLEAFKKGFFQVQDESSMLVSVLLDPKPGEFIIDVCSAPGGKTTHIAELMENKGTVIARDIHEHKIKIINDTAKRLSLNIIKAEIFDATLPDEKYFNKADRVLVDAPCTGLGIIRKKPDIKWAKNLSDKKEINALQSKILTASSKYVKPGGVLVYSTCTIEKEENEDIINKFLKENADFLSVDITDCLKGFQSKDTAKDGYVQFYPNIDGIDGFFMAKLKKRG
jgi:16S rRNA (cytosine967-C5)-methyltransferase